ncbi:DUF3037 domain-containing protein [Bailinhaonella thermotolerans]|uniref:DUF3037 domain-containing protein n=1 Tax=Bailinhaonella thermotolerans TaxID=1070861 RepID=A0A3A4A0A8_9ACTN|nr:DUF3037 domain-containing protein [Bailinhaonella thermotolerans]RJL21695.1 DUF3037 domain-containing protein [Bailinhaonella thermotolerans]
MSRDVFEYALIRVIPSIERGEVVNAGVIVYSQPRAYLCAKVHLDEPRLLALCPAVDVEGVRRALSAYELACHDEEGPLREESLGSRFRWLTAPRSTIVQTGPVHSGLTEDPEGELTRLLDALVR